MTVVRFNVSAMFGTSEPWDCSNSTANLGPRAAELTWDCAMEVARNHEEWLLSPLNDALDYVKGWARGAGAWDAAEIEGWSAQELLAVLVQNVANDLRTVGSDDFPLLSCDEHDCLDEYEERDWDLEPEYPDTHFYVRRSAMNVACNELHAHDQGKAYESTASIHPRRHQPNHAYRTQTLPGVAPQRGSASAR